MAVLPLYIRAHPKDNVAIVVNEGGLSAGSRFESGLVLVTAVPKRTRSHLRIWLQATLSFATVR
jgi:galactarate dehydratase